MIIIYLIANYVVLAASAEAERKETRNSIICSRKSIRQLLNLVALYKRSSNLLAKMKQAVVRKRLLREDDELNSLPDLFC